MANTISSERSSLSQIIPKRYNKISHAWRYIPRAHEPEKPLAEKAKSILAVILFRMHPEKNLITVNNKFLSKFTGCGPKQNRNLIRQLDNIFNIEFKQKFQHEGKTHWNVYVVTPNEKYKINT